VEMLPSVVAILDYINVKLLRADAASRITAFNRAAERRYALFGSPLALLQRGHCL